MLIHFRLIFVIKFPTGPLVTRGFLLLVVAKRKVTDIAMTT